MSDQMGQMFRDEMMHVRLSMEEEERQAKRELAAPDGSADLHAVRWARRMKGRRPFNEPAWTQWHASADACLTLCGLPVVIATEAAFMPDTDDDMARVQCQKCLRKMNPPNSD